MSEVNSNQEVIRIINNVGEDKPWELRFDDISALKRARAILNYPVHKFESEENAVEVAEMLRGIIKADGVAVEGETGLRENTDNGGFYHKLPSESNN